MSKAEIVKEFEKAVKTARRKKEFAGFKAQLRFVCKDFEAVANVRYASINSRDIDELVRERIVMMSKKLKKPVQRKLLGEYKYGYVTEDGEEVPKEDVGYFTQNEDGEWVEVELPPRTKVIEVQRIVDRSKVNEILPEGFYEIWGENTADIPSLAKIAKWLDANDKAGVATFTFGGLRQYLAFIIPKFVDTKFVLVMILTRKDFEYRHLMPIEVKEEEVKKTQIDLSSFVKVNI